MFELKNRINHFWNNRRGNVSIVMGLSIFSAIGLTGLAVDYSRGNQSKSDIFAAADAAALAAARTIGTAAERETVARQVFNANMAQHPSITSVVMHPENVLRDGGNYGYRVKATGKVKTFFGGFFGADETDMSVLAEAIGTISTKTEIVMVLDTTYSMTGWKIDTLRKAATDLVDTLAKVNTKPDLLKFGIVPFSEYVNVGVGNRKKPWMDVPDDWTETIINPPYQVRDVIGQTNCRTVSWPATPPTPPSPPGTCYNDGVPYSCGGGGGSSGSPAGSGQVCDPIYGPPRTVTPPPTYIHHKFYGCVGSRNNPYDTKDESYNIKVPGLMDKTCGTPILEMTSNTNQVKQTIQGLTPNGETYIPAGVMWGWAMLTPKAPFEAQSNTAANPVRKFMILMTDGLNTRSPTYPLHDGSNTTLSNNLTKQICQNIAADRDDGIMVFSVAFAVNDAAIKSILKDCATNTGGQFFDAQNAQQFLTAFSKISSVITELRLSK